ncbi:type II toxin-antitoxin system HicB family antitoxin [Aggregatibacter actinomycetemcomitans]|uniref:type II toxin-antitoxin system HicB family antitoxin n=1 Tax=Aggregatibacter actinomycetemcomitans TaxID=714 RepID=UPI00197B1A3D|nr:type II toxin-antitoxin system HicB family antitoxin [Aggregatibacter actinomycetemcomitans]MBN6074856.1 type II toxin-antitoxin system HicB family antitoxin [Aggregatibacter actinomycetemcomitans]MBN6076988.1 type II toxin-antitoxin system HicB family antitoxin [Aggregatibacter actinomycetemcomitans]
MLFTVGVEIPKNENEAFGLCVPALFTDVYSCFSAADTLEEIIPNVTDAIHTMLEMMVEDEFDITSIKDLGFLHYKQQEDFAYCESWLLVDVDISAFLGKKQRVNVVLPQYLLDRIDNRVAHSDLYRDRSHFLAVASQHELTGQRA